MFGLGLGQVSMGSGGASPSGIAYKRPTLTGQITSYSTGDDAWHLANGTYDYTPPIYPVSYAELDTTALDPHRTLVSDNTFGNTNRYTDINGLQVYGDNYIIDHLTGLGWYRVVSATGTTWDTAISNAYASTTLGYSDWRIPNQQELISVTEAEALTGVFNHSPFNYVSGQYINCSNTQINNSANTIKIVNTSLDTAIFGKAIGVGVYFICRNHFN